MADDGGSTGRIREDLDIIAPGDLRNCLVAMADKEGLMEQLFAHRFGGSGDLTGHSFGNLFIAALIEVLGDVEEAMDATSKILRVRGKVIPSSAEKIRLNAKMTDGRIIEGESQIPHAHGRIKSVFTTPEHPKAIQSLSTPSKVPMPSSWGREAFIRASCRICVCPISSERFGTARLLKFIFATS